MPGMAVGIVKDGKLVFAKGYGVRERGKSEPVGTRTLFQIGSNTKAFTAAALAMLVDAGKLRWDDRVIDYLPQFQLYDAYVTREFTIRDLLSHRSGLGTGAGDLMFFPETDFSREELDSRAALPEASDLVSLAVRLRQRFICGRRRSGCSRQWRVLGRLRCQPNPGAAGNVVLRVDL